jgi:hypothetical protein
MARKQNTPAPAPVVAPNPMAVIAASVTQAVAPVAPVVQAVKTARTGSVAVCVLGTTAYRTTAAHNIAWWQAINAALAAGPQPVAALCALPTAHGVVPGHFVGYALRKGYLQAAPVAPVAA